MRSCLRSSTRQLARALRERKADGSRRGAGGSLAWYAGETCELAEARQDARLPAELRQQRPGAERDGRGHLAAVEGALFGPHGAADDEQRVSRLHWHPLARRRVAEGALATAPQTVMPSRNLSFSQRSLRMAWRSRMLRGERPMRRPRSSSETSSCSCSTARQAATWARNTVSRPPLAAARAKRSSESVPGAGWADLSPPSEGVKRTIRPAFLRLCTSAPPPGASVQWAPVRASAAAKPSAASSG